jgi:hypothetical protein
VAAGASSATGRTISGSTTVAVTAVPQTLREQSPGHRTVARANWLAGRARP